MPDREKESPLSFTRKPSAASASGYSASSALPAGKGRPSSTPVRSMSWPAAMSLVPPTTSARTLWPSGSTRSSSVVPPDRCQARWGLSSKSSRPADQAAAAT